MKVQRAAARATVFGAVTIAVAGAGIAHADPPVPTPPVPTPPSRDVVPPQGHDGPLPQDAVVPMWAPPAPPPPFWAPWLPVVWNTDLNAWGVWWNGDFVKLP
ncbi:hypothetical protein [Mycobacterium sp. 3519A]|uniref:hypothetical protein n=1 Tax=Mycobacterium sp. 3519A TaxID=2057184 RepID=UPI000C7CE63F|nr:hypothetical protein [Mycobacterium sp. 3519A]